MESRRSLAARKALGTYLRSLRVARQASSDEAEGKNGRIQSVTVSVKLALFVLDFPTQRAHLATVVSNVPSGAQFCRLD